MRPIGLMGAHLSQQLGACNEGERIRRVCGQCALEVVVGSLVVSAGGLQITARPLHDGGANVQLACLVQAGGCLVESDAVTPP